MGSEALYSIDIWHAGQNGGLGTSLLSVGSLEKEDTMWIVYLVVGIVGLVFCMLSLVSLESEA